jgi:hypothetical protein
LLEKSCPIDALAAEDGSPTARAPASSGDVLPFLRLSFSGVCMETDMLSGSVVKDVVLCS